MNIGVRRLWQHFKPLALTLLCLAICCACTFYLIQIIGSVRLVGAPLSPGQFLDIELISTAATVFILGIGALAAARWALGFGLVAVAQSLSHGSRARRHVTKAALQLAPRLARSTLITAAGASMALAAVPAVAADPGAPPAQSVTQEQQEQTVYLGFAPEFTAPIVGPQAQPASPSMVTTPEEPTTNEATTSAPGAPQAERNTQAKSAVGPESDAHPNLESAAPRSITVQQGDSLWSLTQQLIPDASKAEVAALWPILYQENLAKIGSNPDLILPATNLTVPSSFSAPQAP